MTPSRLTGFEGSNNLGHAQQSLVHENVPAVAIQRRWLPQGLIATTVHIFAIGTSVVIITICARDTYFKDVQANNVNLYLQIFQFVAKVHDILVAFTLSELALNYLLHDLCSTEGLPLGYLLAPFQLSSPLSLFQREYISALPPVNHGSRKWSHNDWRTIRFASLVFFATIITAIISPLSAILIVPQLDWWDVRRDVAFAYRSGFYSSDSGVLYFNSSYEDLFPSSINATAIPPPIECVSWSCPYYGMQDMYQFGRGYQIFSVTASIVTQEEANAARYLVGGNNPMTFSEGYTVASTPMSGLTRNHATLWLFAQRVGMYLASIGKPNFAIRSKDPTKPLMMPLVQVQCGVPIDISTSTGGKLQATFRANQIKLRQNEPVLQALIEHDVDVTYHVQGFQDNPGAAAPRVSFIDLSTDPLKPLVGVLYSASFANFGSEPGPPYPNMTGMLFNSSDGSSFFAARALFPCILVPNWVPSATQLDPSGGNIVSLGERADPVTWTNSEFLDERALPIALGSAYMNATNPVAPLASNFDNLTVFEYEFSALGVSVGSGYYWFDSAWSDRWPALISTMASLQTADGLARYNRNIASFVWFWGPKGNFSNNLRDLNNPTYAAANAPNQEILGKRSEVEGHPELYTQLEITVQRSGYAWSLGHGWGWNSATLKRFALSVVFLHSILVTAHNVAALTRALQGQRWRCVTWSTPLSIVLLALQTPSDLVTRVRGTSTGVEDKSTYRDMVRIREGPIQKVGDEGEGVDTMNAVLAIRGPEESDWMSRSIAYHKLGRHSGPASQEEDIELVEVGDIASIVDGEGKQQLLQPDRKYF